MRGEFGSWLHLCSISYAGACAGLSPTLHRERTESEQVDARRAMDSVIAHVGVGTFLKPGKRINDAWQLSFKLVLDMVAVRYSLFPLDQLVCAALDLFVHQLDC